MVSHNQRKKLILDRIVVTVLETEKYGEKLVKDKLIAYLSYTYGTHRKTALEYIRTLIGVGKIKETWDRENTYLESVKVNQNIEV